MAITDRATGILISDVSLRDGNWHWLDETPSVTPDGWDSLNVRYVKYSPSFITGEDAGLDFPIGQQLVGRNFWAQGFSGPKCLAGSLLYEINVTYKGFAAAQPAVLTYGTSAEQQQGENILTPNGQHERVVTHQNTPTMNVRYIVADVNSAPVASVGSAQTPPNALTTPPNVWAFLTDYTYHWPNGWVLMGSNPVPLPGTTVALVSDDYQYIQEFSV